MDNLNNASQKALRQYVEQVERLEEEKKGLADDITAKLAEAKSAGFCPKTLKRIIKERKKTKAQREEEDAIFETYARACGLLGLPLQEYADSQPDNVVRL